MKNRKTKAQRLLEKWNFLNSRPNFKDKEKDELDAQEWKRVDKELSSYLIYLAHQGKLFSINTNGHLCSVNSEKENSQREFDYCFTENAIVQNSIKFYKNKVGELHNNYKKQKEINKELVDENEQLKQKIDELYCFLNNEKKAYLNCQELRAKERDELKQQLAELNEWTLKKYNLENGYQVSLLIDGLKQQLAEKEELLKNAIVSKSKLTEVERVILESIKSFQYIERNLLEHLILLNIYNDVRHINFYNHLFTFIKAGEKYEIKELLEELR